MVFSYNYSNSLLVLIQLKNDEIWQKDQIKVNLKLELAGMKLNVPPLANEADSSDLPMGRTTGGNLQGKEGPGGLSRANGYGLFRPTTCITK